MKTKNEGISGGTPEEKLLARQAEDKAALAEKSCQTAHTKFLTPAEAAFLGRYCQHRRLRVVFDGGRDGAERVTAVFLPSWMEEDGLTQEESPVAVLKITNTAGEELSHRDYLGALMARGIRRDTVGDIDVHGAEAYVFCLEEIAEYLASQLDSAGRAKLNVTRVAREEVPPPDSGDGEEIYGTVSSLRLDAVVAEGFNMSREDAKQLIVQGACSVDHIVRDKPDLAVGEGVLISVRGKGRLKLKLVRGETRRGRIGLELVRYGKKR